MVQTVTTTLYTIGELSESARERALDAMRDGWGDTEQVTEQLTDALREAYGPDATVEEWDYSRSSVTVGGTLARPAEVGDGPAFRGWRLSNPSSPNVTHSDDLEITAGWPAQGDLRHTRGAGWNDTEAHWTTDPRPEWDEYVSEVESVLVRLMVAEVEYLSGDDHLTEVAEMNGVPFTEDGRVWTR